MTSVSQSAGWKWYGLVGRAIVLAIVTIVGLELIFWAAWVVAAWIHPDPLRPELSPAYDSYEWRQDFYREELKRMSFRTAYVPFRIWGPTEWHGKYINVDNDGSILTRRTENDLSAGCANKALVNVWIFGGSTVFGTGVPDSATLPSYLSKTLNHSSDACAQVTNFGVEGYVSTQELMLLTELLKRGRHPDVVIFYDGYNDAFTGMQALDPFSSHHGLEITKARQESARRGQFDFIYQSYTVRTFETARQMLHRKLSPAAGEDLPAKAAKVLDNDEANLKVCQALAAAYGFKFYAFWQPTLVYGHKPMVPFEQQMIQFDETHTIRLNVERVSAAFREATRRAPGPGYVDLTGIFDAVADPIYVDEAHLGPRGNELVAEAIAKYLQSHPADAPVAHGVSVPSIR